MEQLHPIENFLYNIYAPIHWHAKYKFRPFLEGLSEDKLKDFFLKIGLMIPRRCILQIKFKLKWRPCTLNPFFEHLMELNDWALKEIEQDRIQKILDKINKEEQK